MVAKSGDTCPACRAGKIGTVSSLRCGERQVRYLRCDHCGMTGKQIVAAGELRKRRGVQ
jgi:hypothetical protein